MDKFFKLKQNNTTVRTEIVAGVTTFFAMAYIIFVNPNMLSGTGMDFTGVMLATCISAAIGTILMGLLSNYPFAQAPGMGLNAFFAFTVCGAMGYTWQQALAAVFISGILFLIISITGLRKTIMKALPLTIKYAIGGGIGLFIALVGLLNTGLISLDSGMPGLGNITQPGIVLVLIGLVLTIVLMVLKVKGALFISIVACTIIGIPMGVTPLPEFSAINLGALGSTAFKLDFAGLFSSGGGILSFVTVIISFLIVDMFDTMGTLIGTANKANMLDKDGNLPRADQAMLADAAATVVGSLLGTSTVTTYVESTAGVAEGGRTGLTSVVTGVLFLLAIVLAPIALMVPSQATAPALIIVGVLMMGTITKIDLTDFTEAVPAFFTIAMMPFAYSIADGIAFGVISYVVVNLAARRVNKIHWLMYLLSVIFIARFVLLKLGV